MDGCGRPVARWRSGSFASVNGLASKPRRPGGVYKGRPITLDHAKIIDPHKKGNGATHIARTMGCSRGAVYKVLGLNGGRQRAVG